MGFISQHNGFNVRPTSFVVCLVYQYRYNMMTSWHGNIFCALLVISERVRPVDCPHKGQKHGRLTFLLWTPELTVAKTKGCPVIWHAKTLMRCRYVEPLIIPLTWKDPLIPHDQYHGNALLYARYSLWLSSWWIFVHLYWTLNVKDSRDVRRCLLGTYVYSAKTVSKM